MAHAAQMSRHGGSESLNAQLAGKAYKEAVQDIVRTTAARPSDFDAKAIVLLDALVERSLALEACQHLEQALEGMQRDRITNWRGYVYTLLRGFDQAAYASVKADRKQSRRRHSSRSARKARKGREKEASSGQVLLAEDSSSEIEQPGLSEEPSDVTPEALATSPIDLLEPQMNRTAAEFVPGRPWPGPRALLLDGRLSTRAGPDVLPGHLFGHPPQRPRPTYTYPAPALNGQAAEFVPGRPWSGVEPAKVKPSFADPGLSAGQSEAKSKAVVEPNTSAARDGPKASLEAAAEPNTSAARDGPNASLEVYKDKLPAAEGPASVLARTPSCDSQEDAGVGSSCSSWSRPSRTDEEEVQACQKTEGTQPDSADEACQKTEGTQPDSADEEDCLRTLLERKATVQPVPCDVRESPSACGRITLVLRRVLNSAECAALLRLAERRQFRPIAEKDNWLASLLWERVKDHVPVVWAGRFVRGLGTRLVFLRDSESQESPREANSASDGNGFSLRLSLGHGHCDTGGSTDPETSSEGQAVLCECSRAQADGAHPGALSNGCCKHAVLRADVQYGNVSLLAFARAVLGIGRSPVENRRRVVSFALLWTILLIVVPLLSRARKRRK